MRVTCQCSYSPIKNLLRKFSGVDWCSVGSSCVNDGGQFTFQNGVYTLSVESPLSSPGSTPPAPGKNKRDVTPWNRGLDRTVRIHARAWPSEGYVELLGFAE